MKDKKVSLALLTSIIFFFLLSYIRSLVSIAIIAEDLLHLSYFIIISSIILIPLFIFLLFWKLQIHLSALSILTSLTWIPIIYISQSLKVYLYLLGFSMALFVFLQLINRVVSNDEESKIRLMSVIIITVFIDISIRSTNYFQGILFESSILTKLTALVIVVIVFALARNIHGLEVPSSSSLNPKAIDQFFVGLVLFSSIYLYVTILGNPGFLTIPLKTNFLISIIVFEIIVISILVFYWLVPRKSIFVFDKPIYLGIFAVLTFVIILLPPWSILFPVFIVLSLLFYVPLISKILSVFGEYFHPLLFYCSFVLSLAVLFVLLLSDNLIFSLIVIGGYAIIVYYIAKNIVGTIIKTSSAKSRVYLFGFIILVLMLTLVSIIPIVWRDTPSPVQPQEQIRVFNYNLHFGIDEEWSISLDDFIELLDIYNPDILTLQEIVSASSTNSFYDYYGLLKYVLEPRGYKYAAISKASYFHVRNAVFSKFPIIEEITFALEPVLQYPRSVIITQLDIKSSMIYVASTHLTNIGSSNGTDKRQAQVNHLLNAIKSEIDNNPIILAGDFNAVPTSTEYQLVTSEYVDSWIGSNQTSMGYTSSSENPKKRIDYIFVSDLLEIHSCEVINTQVSDHLPLVCIFEI